MKIGLRAHDIPLSNETLLSQAIREYGFDGIQLVTNKALKLPIDQVNVSGFNQTFEGIEVMMLGAYFNMVHPDQNEVEKGIKNFVNHLSFAKAFKTNLVGTETGSLMGSPWGYMPENHSDERFNQVVEVTKKLIDQALVYQVNIAIEGAYNHVIYSPQRLKELVDKLNSPVIRVTIDLYNFLNIFNHENHLEIFTQAIDLLKDKIDIIHLKDYHVVDQQLVQCGLGEGLMNYQELIKIIKKEVPHAYLIFEGVKYDKLASSKSFIDKLVKGV